MHFSYKTFFDSVSIFLIFKELKNAEGAQSKVDAAREQVFGPQGLKHYKFCFSLLLLCD